MKKKIPYGISNFSDLILQDYYYVDKTKFIETLENFHEKYLFFLRPRRFGKSLLISVLENYYNRNKAELADKLFKDLYIASHPTPFKNSYYILSFDFSGINIDEEGSVLANFKGKILKATDEFLANYNIEVAYDRDSTPNFIFDSFITAITPFLKGKLYVLIDEYDHFTSDLLGYKKEVFEKIVAKSGFYRKFFEVLKIGTKTIIDRIFITGVNPFTLDSLTSGFNIGSDLTLHEKLNEMLGFTEDELVKIFNSWEIEETVICQTLPIMKKNYNGYLFSKNAPNRIYNSDMVLYYLKDFLTTGNPPEELIDENIATSYYKIRQYIQLGNREENLKVVRDILEGKQIFAPLTKKFDLGQNFSTGDLKSLFFYMGLLTLVDSRLGILEMAVPNYVIKELYFSFFNELIEKEAQYRIETLDIQLAMRKLAEEGDLSLLIKLTETVLHKLSKRDYIRFDEKYVKLIFLTYCFLSKMYYVKSEYEVEGGFIDIALLPNDVLMTPYTAILELKYCKKDGYTEALLNSKISESKIQLAKYKQAEELGNLTNLLKFIVVFKGDECVFCEQWNEDDQ